MVDFVALLTNTYGLLKFFHTIFSGYVVAAFFVMGVSAWHLLRKTEQDLFHRSFRLAASFGLAASVLAFVVGDFHAAEVARTQPTKFAAMESVWETRTAAPYHLLLVPDVENERNSLEALSVPKMLSLLAFHNGDAEVRGLKDFPKADRPPVLPVLAGFRGMAALGMLFMLLTLLAVILSRKARPEPNQLFLRLMLWSLPLPYAATQLGWIVAEVGRQPWIVYRVLRTSDAVSRSVSVSQVAVSLTAFALLYGLLAIVDIYLLFKFARKGPDEDTGPIVRIARQEV